MMMAKHKTIWLIALACLLLAVGALCYVMYMPHRDITREKPIVVTAVELTDAYQKDEPAANEKYLNRALQVSGTVNDVETNNDGKSVITLAGATPLSGVRCTLQKNITVETGKTVILKGRCTGYLSDVVLIDCVLVE